MRICSAAVLSYLDAGFSHGVPRKEFILAAIAAAAAACYLLLAAHAAKKCSSPCTLRRVVKRQHGKPSLVIKSYNQDRVGFVGDTHRRHLLGTLVIVLNLEDDHLEDCLKIGQRRPFLNTKLAIERATWLEIAQNLLQMKRICSVIHLSY